MSVKEFNKVNERFHREVFDKDVDTRFYKTQIAALERSARKLKRTYGVTEEHLQHVILQKKCELLMMEHENLNDNGKKLSEYLDAIAKLQEIAPFKYE